MKIDVITMQAVYNYGSALQTYATQRLFCNMGYEVDIIDYYPKRMRNYGSLKQIYTEVKPFHKKVWKSAIVSMLKYPSMRKQKVVFQAFAEKYYRKTKPYYSNEELCDDPPVADIYCTGSDQVWNDYLEEGNFDRAYFLDFAPTGKKKISYAASFGRHDITKEELKPVHDLLEDYQAISVREESGLTILKEVDCSIKECVLDPTFLLGREEWMELSFPVKENGYILVYQLHEETAVSEAAMQISKKTGKQVIRLSSDFFKRFPGGKTIVAPKIEEFISYIAKADLVVTDSFHATAFSVNMNIPFVSLKWKMFNDRIETILENTGLSERSVRTAEEALMIYAKPIDYTYVNEKLNALRVKSKSYLKIALE